MTRQYIGARYVPIIDGEYNSEKVYEPLTIVTYNGSSYTSKKSVPAGTLPTNTEYWALTGNYNAQVEQYRQEVENLRGTYDSVADTINFLDMHNKKILIIGDSNSDSAVVSQNWAVQFKTIAEKAGANVSIDGINGACLLSRNGISSITTRYRNRTKDVDYFIIELGVNDWLYNEKLSDIDSEMRALMDLINTSDTPPEVYWMLPFKTNDTALPTYLPLDFYRAFYVITAQRYGIRLIDGTNAPMLSLRYANKYYNPDGMNIHPNAFASAYIARYAYRKLLSGGDNAPTIYTTEFPIDTLISGVTAKLALNSDMTGVLTIDGTITPTTRELPLIDLSSAAGESLMYVVAGRLSMTPLSAADETSAALVTKKGSTDIRLELGAYTSGKSYVINTAIPVMLNPYPYELGYPNHPNH